MGTTRVPDWDCWKERGTNVHPGDEVDVCVMPRCEPRYDYPNHWDWFYSVARINLTGGPVFGLQYSGD